MKGMAKTIGEGTFWLSFNSIVIKVVSLISVFFILSRLNLYEYGLVQLAYSSVGLFAIFVLPGLADMVLADMGVAKANNNPGEIRRIFSSYFWLQMFLAVVAWAILFFGSEIIAQYYKGQISVLLKIISFTFLFSPARAMYMLLFSFNFKFFYQSTFSLLEEVFKVLLMLVGFFVFKYGPESVIFAGMLSQVVVLLCYAPLYISLKKEFNRVPKSTTQPFWHLLYKHGKWSIVNNYTHGLVQHIRLFIVRIFLGTEAVGIFSLAQGLLSNTVSLFPLNRAVSPVLSQYSSDRDSFFRLVYKSIKYQILGFLVAGVAAFFFVPILIETLFPQYSAALPLFKIMLLALIPMGYGTITTVYYVFKLQRVLSILEVLRLLFVIVTTVVCITLFGIYGPAVEVVFTVMVFVWTRNRILSKIIPHFSYSLSYLIKIDQYDKIVLARVMGYLRNKLRFLGV